MPFDLTPITLCAGLAVPIYCCYYYSKLIGYGIWGMGYCHYHVRLYQFKKVLLQSLILCQLLKVAAAGTGHGNAVSLQNRYYFPLEIPWRSHIVRSLHSAFADESNDN
ncbi:MAG: hypothetical protein ICV85_10805 [Tolypothrix sp. T3-bin4]|nr:hypothetical protein [Tolypothrix sp. T3-bin4]